MSALGEVYADLDRLCATAMPGGSRRVAVWGPKGGTAKTTVAAALLHLLGERLVGMLAGVDANPDGGTLTERLGLSGSYVRGRLSSLAQNPGAVGYLADWARYLDRVGRIHLLHNDGVPGAVIARMSVADYTQVLDLLARYAEIQIVDLGTGVLHPASIAALNGAHHIVIATSADPSALHRTSDAVDELAALSGGFLADRLSAATVAVTRTDPRSRPAGYLDPMQALGSRTGHVQLIGYDKGAGAVGPIRFDRLAAATRLAYAQTLQHVLTQLRRIDEPEQIPESISSASTARACPGDPIAAPSEDRDLGVAQASSQGTSTSQASELPAWASRNTR